MNTSERSLASSNVSHGRRQALDRHGLLERRRLAESGEVDGKHVVLVRQSVELVVPGLATERPAVDEENRLARALLLHPHLHSGSDID